MKFDDEIDCATEIDGDHFWNLVNNKRKTSNTSPGSEMVFSGAIFRDEQNIYYQWHLYFENLYSPSNNFSFDSH